MPALAPKVDRRPSTNRAAFTLMEVLLVLVILVVLSSIAVPVCHGIREAARRDAAAVQIGIFKTAVNNYVETTNAFPPNLDALLTPPGDAKLSRKWAGPYIERLPLDPWDNPYRYAAPGKHNPDSFDVWSAGPDGRDGTDDDIGNWQ